MLGDAAQPQYLPHHPLRELLFVSRAEFCLPALAVVEGDGVFIGVKAGVLPRDIVRGDDVEVLLGELPLRVCLKVLGLSGKARGEGALLAPCNLGDDVRVLDERQRELIGALDLLYLLR